jgi:hypothetical protein
MRDDQTPSYQPELEPLPADMLPPADMKQFARRDDHILFHRPDLESVIADIVRDNPAATRENILALLILFGA